MAHVCPECGFEHESVAVESVEPVEPAPVADAAVAIAAIEAERDVTIAEIGVAREVVWQESRVAQLEAEVAELRAAAAAATAIAADAVEDVDILLDEGAAPPAEVVEVVGEPLADLPGEDIAVAEPPPLVTPDTGDGATRTRKVRSAWFD